MNDNITIVGVVGTDPERRTPNGLPITSFRVGSTQRRFDKGKWVDGETSWYTVSTFHQLAEHAFQSIRRRDRVIVTGRLKVREWQSGDKRGIHVDIDADAIGHDLLFGTTAYTPDRRRSDAVEPAPDPEDASESWAVAVVPDSSALDDDASEAHDDRTLALSGAEPPF